MQRWGQYLAEAPQTLLRLIASQQRVSMPRGCGPEERLARLRAAICRPQAAREVFASLHPEERAAVQALLAAAPGVARARLSAGLGPIRSLEVIRRDRTPRSLAERLLLLGWLLPRPARPQHPAAYLLAPELRVWLPRPLALPEALLAPEDAVLPLALRAATAIILASARAPLPLRRAGRPTAALLRRLRPLLAPAPAEAADALATWLLPLLVDADLLAPQAATLAAGPAARRFLGLPPAARLERLRSAWVASVRPEAWLTRLRVCTRGLAWPALRRRLLAWAEALPPDRLVDRTASYESLRVALGPLADSYTHRLRPAGRSPWQPRRAAAVWQAALDGPLAWLGVIMHADAAEGRGWIYQSGATQAPPAQPAWRYGDLGMLHLPHAADDADLLDLQPFAFPLSADAEATTYRLSRASVAAAVSRGQPASRLRALLEQRAGPPPDGWGDLLTPTEGGLHLRQRSVLLSDTPELLAQVARQPGVRRQIEARLAPGVALVAPGAEAALGRALERAGVGVEGEQMAELEKTPSPPSPLSLGGRGGVEPVLVQNLPSPLEGEGLGVRGAAPPDLPATLDLIRQAIRRRRALHLHYQSAAGVASARWVQPLELERHGDRWLLHAYCLTRQAERCFRLDRITQLDLGTPPQPDRTPPARPPRRPPPAPPSGFFAPPPENPLLRVWLE